MSSQEPSKSMVQNLWDRRFFQYLGTYLGISFGLIQFMDFLVNRYDLDVNLVDKLFIFLLALLPAVIVFIYNHGRPGHDQWRPFEKVFIPASLIVGITLSMLLFNDSSARAATEKISIATLEGKQETRLVPKLEFTKRYVVFPFENTTGEESQSWMRIGLPYLLDKDMEQFMMNFSISPVSMKGAYNSYNVKFPEQLPFSTQLKISQDYYSDYFITGKFSRDGGQMKLNGQVYDSQSGKLFFEKEYLGQDLFDLADQFSVGIKEALFPKDNLPKETAVDLPASNLVTEDIGALQAYIEGITLFRDNVQQAPKAIEKLEAAVKKDPRCATCFSALSEMYFAVSNETRMKETSDKAVALAGILPERQKLLINYYNYNVNNQWKKATMLLDNWSRLYPHDYTPYSLLMTYYLQRLQWANAEEVGLRALENGHQGSLLYSLADLYIKKGEFEKAEKYIEQFYDLYPHKSKDKSLLEKIYSGRGELEKAKALYEKELIMDPGNVDMLIKMADLEDKLGNFSATESYLKEALQKSLNTHDSVKVITQEEMHLSRLGQFDRLLERSDQRTKLMKKYIPASQLKQMMFFSLANHLALNGKEEDYFQTLENLKEELPQNAPFFDCIGNYLYHMWTDNKEAFITYSDKCMNDYIRPMYGPEFEVMDKAVRAELNEDFPTAIQYYQAYIDSTGVGDVTMSFGLAMVFRKSGQLDKAAEQIDSFLKLDPNQPMALLEKARILFAQGNKAEAEQLHERLMEIWKNADESYRYYQEALTFGESLKNES